MTKLVILIFVIIAVFSFWISPTLGLIIFTLIVISVIIIRKKSKYHWTISFLVGIGFFLLLNDIVVKRQAELIVNDLFDFKQKKNIVPKSLNDVYDNYFMSITPTFDQYIYKRRNLSDGSYEWKLEFKNIWGTEYFYDDKTGNIEKRENWQGVNHWNKCRKTK